jgi:ribosomal subunit interface protein
VDIVITGRRTEVTDRFRRLAEEKLAKVSQFSPTAFRIDVELSHERNPRQSSHCERVEITVRDKGPVIRAEACAEDLLAALDLAFGKLLERLRRSGDRKKVHHGRHAPASVRGISAAADSMPGGDLDGAGSQVGLALAERPVRYGRWVDGDLTGRHNGHNGHQNGHRRDRDAGLRSSLADDAQVDEFEDVEERVDLPAGAEDLADSPVVIRTKDHEATPMTIDQALYEMELVGHDFYLFVDAACGKPSVVYRRRGWNYGVIRLAVEAADEAAMPQPSQV